MRYICDTCYRNNVEKTIMKEIYFAGGCFWGTEHFFSLIDGMEKTEVGLLYPYFSPHFLLLLR